MDSDDWNGYKCIYFRGLSTEYLEHVLLIFEVFLYLSNGYDGYVWKKFDQYKS